MIKVKQEILKVLYRESQDNAVEMTSGEIFWKTDDPAISEPQIKEALDDLVQEGKVSHYLSKYSLDKRTFLEIKQSTTPKKIRKEKVKITQEKTSLLNSYKNKGRIENINKHLKTIVPYIFTALVIFMLNYFFFNGISANNLNLLAQNPMERNNISLQDIVISKTRFSKNPANEVAYALQLEAKNNKEIVKWVNQLIKENDTQKNALIKIINEKQNEIMDYQNKVNITLVVTLFLTFLILLLNRNKF